MRSTAAVNFLWWLVGCINILITDWMSSQILWRSRSVLQKQKTVVFIAETWGVWTEVMHTVISGTQTQTRKKQITRTSRITVDIVAPAVRRRGEGCTCPAGESQRADAISTKTGNYKTGRMMLNWWIHAYHWSTTYLKKFDNTFYFLL